MHATHFRVSETRTEVFIRMASASQFRSYLINDSAFVERRCTDALVVIENGYTQENNKGYYEFEDEISFSCNLGYILQGESTIRCESDGTWSYYTPVCISK